MFCEAEFDTSAGEVQQHGCCEHIMKEERIREWMPDYSNMKTE